ncbi:MAG: peptidoglycan-binding domain-containing protein [Patescibacteria group bacterium]
MYTAVKNKDGNYEVSFNGQRVSTGSASGLLNYGLSETQLSSSAPAPTAIGTQTTQQAIQQTTQQTIPQSTTTTPPINYTAQQEAERQRLAVIAEENRKNALISQANQLKSSGAGTTGIESFLSGLSPADKQLTQGIFGSNVPTSQTIEDGIRNLGIPTSNLQPGMRGAEVKKLQDYLVSQGLMTQAQVNTGYGIYGPQTTAAVKDLQSKLGVDNSTGAGYFGPRTIKSLSSGGIITSDSSRGETPLGITPFTSNTTHADSIAAGADATLKSIQDYIDLLTPPESKGSKTVDDLIASINADLEGLKGRGASQLEAEQANGVNAKKQALQSVQNQMNIKLAEFKVKQVAYEKLAVDAEGRPVTMGTIIGQQAQIQRMALAEKNAAAAEIGLLQAQALGLQGDLQFAQESANRAVDLRYQDVVDSIKIRQEQLTLLEGQLTKQEKIRSDAIILYLNDQKTKIAIAQANEKELAKFNLDSMTKYPSAGVRVNDSYETTQRKILGSSEYKLEQAKARKDAGIRTDVSVSLAGLTPEQQSDPFIKLLLSTEGGKPITDTFAQSLNKGLNVLGQIGVLQENIKNTNTGPIAGAFRGANPWDTNAQTIKAQLNAIVPNLARGIYGEVGVLTDNDVKLYAKTLPTLTSTEDIRNAVLGITVDVIGKAIKRTLEINAANQKDVSGFVDIYTEMTNTRNSIFSQIPGYKGAGAQENQIDDVAAESAFDSVVTPKSSSWLVNMWNNLFK